MTTRIVYLKMEAESERLLTLAGITSDQGEVVALLEREQQCHDIAISAMRECRRVAAETAPWN